MDLLFNVREYKFPVYPYGLCHHYRHPESRAALSSCQAQLRQTGVCGRPISSVAQEDLRTLLSAQSRLCPPWEAGTVWLNIVWELHVLCLLGTFQPSNSSFINTEYVSSLKALSCQQLEGLIFNICLLLGLIIRIKFSNRADDINLWLLSARCVTLL